MTKHLPRIKTAKVMAPYTLRVAWQDGRIDTVNLEGMIAEFAPFAPLREPAMFATVRVMEYGDGLEWEGGFDYSADTLRQLADDQRVQASEDITGSH